MNTRFNTLRHWFANTRLTTRVSSLIFGMMLFLALLTAQLQWAEHLAEQHVGRAQQLTEQKLQLVDQWVIDWLLLKNALDAAHASGSLAQPWTADSAIVQARQKYLDTLHAAEAAFYDDPLATHPGTPATDTKDADQLKPLNALDSLVQGYLQLITAAPTEGQNAWLKAGASAIAHKSEQLRADMRLEAASNYRQAQQHISQARERTWLMLLLALALGLLWGWLIIRSIRQPLLRLFAHTEQMTKGDFAQEIPYTTLDNELGQMARIIAQLQASARQTQAEHWIKSQQAALLTLMQSATRFTDLTRSILNFLCPELGAAQGGFYIFDPRQQSLRLLGGYAFTERKAHHPYFKLGEGLVGQCALERSALHIHEPPPGYFTVSSSLGQGTPGQLYLVPITTPNRILGVIELATFSPMSTAQWQLLEAVLPLISLSIEMLEQRGANANGELTPLTQGHADSGS